MTQYTFTISNGGLFTDTQELPNDDAAWSEAVHTVRDVETVLSPRGGEWSLTVARKDKPIYRIVVSAQMID